jgi:hypothetical protein
VYCSNNPITRIDLTGETDYNIFMFQNPIDSKGWERSNSVYEETPLYFSSDQFTDLSLLSDRDTVSIMDFTSAGFRKSLAQTDTVTVFIGHSAQDANKDYIGLNFTIYSINTLFSSQIQSMNDLIIIMSCGSSSFASQLLSAKDGVISIFDADRKPINQYVAAIGAKTLVEALIMGDPIEIAIMKANMTIRELQKETETQGDVIEYCR